MAKKKAAPAELIFTVQVPNRLRDLIPMDMEGRWQVRVPYDATVDFDEQPFGRILDKASKTAGKCFVDRASVGRPRDYLDQVNEIREEITIVDIELDIPDAKRKRYNVECFYSGSDKSEGTWGDDVFAANYEEADLKMRFFNTAARGELPIYTGDYELENFGSQMADVETIAIFIEPLAAQEAIDLLTSLVRNARAANVEFDGLDDAEKTLRDAGIDIDEDPATPKM